jgi:gamma-butyrobetaine dioxygenase
MNSHTVANHPIAFDMADLANYQTHHTVKAVDFNAKQLEVHWDDGRASVFHATWLRDNCACGKCKHPKALERTYMFFDHARPEIKAIQVVQGMGVVVEFLQGTEQHSSQFSWSWLRHHCYSKEALAERQPIKRLWDAQHQNNLVVVDFNDYFTTDNGVKAWMDALLKDGIVVLRGVPTVSGKLIEVANRVGPVRSSNFGEFYDVISMPNPNAVAYTSLGLELHTDLVNWGSPPDIQMLCCLANSVVGGGSIFADGFRVAQDLRQEDPESFQLLSSYPLSYRFHDQSCDIATDALALELDPYGHLSRIRFNNWLRSSVQLPAELIEPMYGAIAALWKRLRDKKYHLTTRLAAGELITYDNSRVLHGRESFDANTGNRHLQGCYMNREEIASKRAVLARV